MGTNNTDTTPATGYTNPVLINRNDELNAIQEMLYRLTTPGRLLPKPILEFNGIGGIGKTMLLKKFWEESKAREGLHCAFIDFHKFAEEQQTSLNKLILDIVRQIGIKNESFFHIEATAGDPEIKQDLTSSFIEYLKIVLQTPQKEIPVALIFDSVDEVDRNIKDWLISLVVQTIEAGKILFAIASKMSLGFSQIPNLEKKVYAFKLEEFNQEFTLHHIQQGFRHLGTENLQNWASVVFRLTQGHPLANEIVVSEACKKQYMPQAISRNQYDFIKIIDKVVVKEKVFHGYDDEMVNKFRQMLAHLSIPRMFNLVSMGKIIGEFAPQYALKSSWHYSNYIRELQSDTSFIRYSREKSAYTVDPILRSVFSFTLKNESPEKFTLMHQFLVDMYTNWITDAKGTDKTKYFIEKIYHQLSLDISPVSLIPQFQEFAEIIAQIVEEERQRDAKQQFIEEFKTDPDLGEFFDELTKNNIQKLFE